MPPYRTHRIPISGASDFLNSNRLVRNWAANVPSDAHPLDIGKKMTKKITTITTITSIGVFCLCVCGCLYRGDGPFKKIGDSDYKARINFMNLFAVADGRPTYVCGVVLLEDRITPLKDTVITLKKYNQQSIVSHTNTDNTGNFNMSGILVRDSFLIEIDSPDYFGEKKITVEPNKNNWHEIIAHKK